MGAGLKHDFCHRIFKLLTRYLLKLKRIKMSLKKHEKQLLDILDYYSEDIAALIPDTAGLHPVTLNIDGTDFDADFATAGIFAVIEIDTIPANEWGESESLYYRGFDTCKIVVDGIECDYSSVRIKFSNMCARNCNF